MKYYFSNKKAHSILKLIDFGLAPTKRKKKKLVYPYPEATIGNSWPKSDIWSVGVTIYLMINCKYAFMVESNDDKFQDLYKKIQTKKYELGPLVDSGWSKEEIGFIKGCLTKNIFNRFDTR